MSTDRYDWAAMRADVESGRVKSFAELSAKYGATEQAIRNRRKADEKAGNPWPLPKIARAQDTNVIDLSQRRGHASKRNLGEGQSRPKSDTDPGDIPDERVPDEAEFESVDPLSEQKMLGVMAQRAARRGLRRYLRGAIEPGMHQSEADVLNALLAAAARATSMNREIAGKGKGEASTDGDGSNEPVEVVIRTERIAPANRAEVLSKAEAS
ncbi:MAG TPA: hypothetical protein VFA29_07830 [Candidatus Baltobacteraceae bacterium]|nr:hypothetical protein [Candidatus Baltobacteraceae bacterium]